MLKTRLIRMSTDVAISPYEYSDGMHNVARSHTLSLRAAIATLAASFGLLSGVGCVSELSPHSREEHADHTIAFVAQDGELKDQLTLDVDGFYVTPEMVRDDVFNRIAIRYDVPAEVIVEARARTEGTWGAWSEVTVTFAEESAHNAMLDVAGNSDAAQLRFRLERPDELSFLAVETLDYQPADADVDLDIDAEPMSEDLQGLAADGIVVTRSQWGARSRNCGPRHSPNRLTIHHTVTPNGDSMSMPARVRQIQNYHINNNGWCDIGYHFLIGQDGKVYQGRVENIVGAHAGGANTNNVGISFIGTFTSRAPSDAMLNAGARIMKSMSRTYNIALNRDKVKGHRQVGSTSTACPGDALYTRLSNLISLAQNSGSGSGGGGTTASCTQVRINADTLNVRPTASTSRAAVGAVHRGDRPTRNATVTGQSINGNTRWYQITKGSLRGYVSAAYATCVN